MGGRSPRPDPNIAKRQQEELDRAEAERDRLRKERNEASAAARRGRRGRLSLLATEGRELGVKSLLGGDR